MRKLVKRVIVLAVIVAVCGPSVATAGHAPHYPKKDHPVHRQKKMERLAAKKARAQRAR